MLQDDSKLIPYRGVPNEKAEKSSSLFLKREIGLAVDNNLLFWNYFRRGKKKEEEDSSEKRAPTCSPFTFFCQKHFLHLMILFGNFLFTVRSTARNISTE